MAELKIKADSGGGTVSWKGPGTTTGNAAVQLTLPQNDGDAGQVLQTDGSGNVTFQSVSISDKFTSGLSFDTSTGVLTATVTNGSNVTEDLDGLIVRMPEKQI